MPNETQDNLKTLHRNLLKEGYQIPIDYSKFQMDMRDDNKIQKLWGNLKSEYDLPEFDKFKSDMGMAIEKAPLIKTSVEETMLGGAFEKSKSDHKEALDRSIDLYNRANNLNPNSPESKSKRKQYEDGLANGDYSITTGPSGRLKLARKASIGEAFTNTLKGSTKSYNESKNLKGMSDDAAINYLEDKFSKEEVMPSTNEDALSKIGETAGGLARLVAKQGAGATAVQGAALLLAPETGGLSLAALAAIGGIAGAGDELSTQEYGGNLMKYYMQGKAEGLSPKDAIQRARTQAERAAMVGYGEAVGYELAGKAVGRLFPKNVAGEGVKAAVGKFLLNAAPEVVGAATIAGGSSLAKDLSAKELGYKVSNKEMFDNAWTEASDIGKFMLATTALHGVANGVTKVPNYVKSQLKNYVTSVEDGLGEKVLNNLKNAGVLKAADVEKTLGTLKDFKKAKKDIEPLGVDDETIQGSLAGKQEKKNKLKSEIDELNKNGVKVGVKKKQGEIDKLDKEMEAIHETGDVDKHEHDQDFGINARVEETKGGKKLFIDDLEVTPEEFEYVTGKKPEEYPAEPIEPTKEVKPTEKKDISFSKDYQGIKTIQDIVSADSNKELLNEVEFLKTPEGQEFLNDLKEDYKGKGKEFPSMSDKEAYEIDRRAKMADDLIGAMAKQGVDLDMFDAFNMVDKIDEAYKKKAKKQERQGLERLSKEIFGEEKTTETKLEDQYSFSKKTDKQLELRYKKLESSERGTPERQEFNAIEKELNKRERRSVLDAPLENIPKIIDKLKGTEGISEVENTKKVAIKYSEENVSKLKDKEIVQDFKDAINRGADTFYSEGLKVRETIKEAAKRNIDLTKEYLKDFSGNPEKAKENIEITLNNLGFEMPKKQVKRTIKVKLTEEQKQSNIDKATAEQRAEAIKQTEQEYGSTTDKGLPTGETTGVSRDVSSEPASKIESIKSATTEQYTHTDAGFRDESDARAAYEQRGDKDVSQTYEEFLFSKACGDF